MTLSSTFLALRRLRDRFSETLASLPRLILVQHFRSIEALLFLGVLLVALYTLGELFWGNAPSDTRSSPAASLQLSEETIDELEFWIEEQQGRRSRGLNLPPREYFVREGAIP